MSAIIKSNMDSPMKTKTSLTTIILFFLIFTSQIVFAEERQARVIHHGFGLSAGWVVGNGLLYRHYFGKNFLQGSFAGLIDKEEDEAYLDVSVSYGRYLNTLHYDTVGAPIGLKWIFGGEAVYDEVKNTKDNRLNFGTGIGLDIGSVNVPGLLISFDLIYTVSYAGLSEPEFTTLMLRPAVGVVYNF